MPEDREERQRRRVLGSGEVGAQEHLIAAIIVLGAI